MAAYKDIQIKWTSKKTGRRYEAVSFLGEGESSDEMFSRADGENGGAIGEEDEALLRQDFDDLPKELQPYHLFTNRRDPDSSRYVSCFAFDDGRWDQGYLLLGYPWDDHSLVVRRCP